MILKAVWGKFELSADDLPVAALPPGRSKSAAPVILLPGCSPIRISIRVCSARKERVKH